MSFIADKWADYEILDAGDGEKLERWGDILTIRPDPQIIWRKQQPKLWGRYHLRYHRSSKGGGQWESRSAMESWTISYDELTFKIKPTDFKHMGLFPEQAANWDWLRQTIERAGRPIKALNLFGYTGGATCACLSAGASVTHVDAAKGMNNWARENMRLSGLAECRIISDDVLKFVQRERRRRNFYDAIILDPPSYGRGARGEVWKLEDRLFDLLVECVAIFSENPLLILLNTYTTGFGVLAMENVLKLALKSRGFAGVFESGSLGLPIEGGEVLLPCGVSVRGILS
ncbi:MAG: class I SAM-dependent methyltransferase [Turicibacter sp.]|nr:class I SAM-dependent methyltransferase [Turicibacter sp.]